LHALLLIELADSEHALAALRRTLYLDGRLAIAHFTLGTLLARSGDRRAAERAFRNAEQVAAARPAAEEVPLSDGLAAAGLALAARRELGLMAAATGVGR
jgi:chemotaxis protein methyltransferase CheR